MPYRPRRRYFLPALLATMLVTMGPFVGPKERKVKPNKTTLAQLEEEFFPAARTTDGRFLMYSFFKWRTYEPFVMKVSFSKPGLLLVEMNDQNVVVQRKAHKCDKHDPAALCRQPADDAILALIAQYEDSDTAANYGHDDLRVCEVRGGHGYLLSEGSNYAESCRHDPDVRIQIHMAR